jgi:hypothetical protein
VASVDTSLVWTAFGTIATCLAVGVGWRQMRLQAQEVRVLGSAEPSPNDVVGTSVRVPTGNLPAKVRGRDTLLTDLRRSLRRPPGYSIVLAGMGGIGKSTVAAAFAERSARVRIGGRHPLVWWVSATDPASLAGALVTVARHLGASHADLEAIRAGVADAPDRLWALLQRTRRRWLLIFDNVDDPVVLARPRDTTDGGAELADVGSVADGTSWLRPTRRGLVVVTGRHASPTMWGRHARVIQMSPLGDKDAAQVLLDRAPLAGNEADAHHLAHRLGGLPLTLMLAGSYLNSDVALRTSFRDYLQGIDGDGTQSPLLTSTPGWEVPINDRMVVIRTWELSLDALDRSGIDQARPLLRLLSCYAPTTSIPMTLLAPERLARLIADRDNATSPGAATAEHRLAQGLHHLQSLGLITVRPRQLATPTERAVVVHPVVADTNRMYLRDANTAKETAGLIRRAATELVVAAVRGLDYERVVNWPPCFALEPHLHALFDTVARQLDRPYLDDLMTATITVSGALHLGGAASAGEGLLRAALQVMASLPDDDPICLTLRHELAWPVAYRGRPAEAEAIYRGVLEARLNALGGEHPLTLNTRHELAWTLTAQGRWAEAETMYRDVLSARQRILGSDDPDTLITQDELGWAIARQGRSQEAEPILRHVLDARRRVLGEDHPRTIKAHVALAWIAAHQHRWGAAESAYRQWLDVRIRLLGAGHPDTLAIRHELAWVLAEQGRRRAALTEYQQTLDLRRRHLGEQHPDTVATSHALERLRHGLTTPADHLA